MRKGQGELCRLHVPHGYFVVVVEDHSSFIGFEANDGALPSSQSRDKLASKLCQGCCRATVERDAPCLPFQILFHSAELFPCCWGPRWKRVGQVASWGFAGVMPHLSSF